MAAIISSVHAISPAPTEAGALSSHTGVGRSNVNIFRCTYAVAVRPIELTTLPPIQPRDQIEPLAVAVRLGHAASRSTSLLTARSGSGLAAYREMSPKECGAGSWVANIRCIAQNVFSSIVDLVGGAAASNGLTRVWSSLIGPMYWPLENTSIASRGPPRPTGAAWAIATALSAGGAVRRMAWNAARTAAA